MSVLGYQVGPIACEAAFIADFDVSGDIPLPALVGAIDSDRRTMAAQPGMRSKYVPFRYDPATGARQIGGRYLFERWSDVESYMRFTSELEFEPSVKFWDRPFFSNIDKQAWQVVGAEEFTAPADHYTSRFERLAFDRPLSPPMLEQAWAIVRDAAWQQGLASIWLLREPNTAEVGLVTAAARIGLADDAQAASQSLDRLAQWPSLATFLPGGASAVRVRDRTSLNLTIWLPVSDRLGGDAAVFPTFPAYPKPEL